jgi:hypothetical protein
MGINRPLDEPGPASVGNATGTQAINRKRDVAFPFQIVGDCRIG